MGKSHSGLNGDIKRNNEIGTMAIFGPEFRVSFDLFVNSHGNSKKRKLSVMDFKGNDGKRKRGVLAIFINRKGLLRVKSSVRRKGSYNFKTAIKLKTWHNITIQQKYNIGELQYTVLIDGKELQRKKNKDKRKFFDVKVFAGGKNQAAD